MNFPICSEEIIEIDIKGYQVVQGEMFSFGAARSEPTLSIRKNRIFFNKRAIDALNKCERVRIEVNPEERCILIVPVTIKDKDGVRWTKNVKEPAPRVIECTSFVKQLYELWGWDNEVYYRAKGRLVTSDKKLMLLFDFKESETWKSKEKVK